MAMDQCSREFCGTKGLNLGDETFLELWNQNLISRFKMDNTFVDQNYTRIPPLPNDPIPSNLELTSCVNSEGDSHEVCDFSDVVLRYINQMLMEEDMGEKACMFQEALQATEKSLYEALREKYPPTPYHGLAPYVDQNYKIPDESYALNQDDYTLCTSSSRGTISAGAGWTKSSRIVSLFTPQSSYSSSHRTGNVVDGLVDSPVSPLGVPEIFCESESVMQFKRGFEEANRFLPNGNGLIIADLESNSLFLKELKEDAKDVVVKIEEYHESQHSLDGMRKKKNPYPVDVNLKEGRINKQSAVSVKSTVTSEMFDMVLLNDGKCEFVLHQAFQNGTSENVQQNGRSKGSNGGKACGKSREVKWMWWI